jgi:hypothetical protein
MRAVGGLAAYVLFTVAVSAVLASILPALLLPYLVVSVVGGVIFLAGQRPGATSTPKAANSLLDDPKWGPMAQNYLRETASAEQAARLKAEAVHGEPWYADAVVDMSEVQRKWAEREGPFAAPNDVRWLTVPNPYFVLPVPKLVEWGFASAVDVREALRWANSPTPPMRWRNRAIVRVVGLMGWPDTEVWARIGLYFWSKHSEAPSPDDARAEATARSQGQVFDVPKPASLD